MARVRFMILICLRFTFCFISFLIWICVAVSVRVVLFNLKRT